MAEIIEGYGLGYLVDPQDVDQLTQVLLELLEEPHLRRTYRPSFVEAAKQLTWDRVAEPLIQFCRHPYRAPDKVALGKGELYDHIAALERVLRTRESQLIADLEQHARNLEALLRAREDELSRYKQTIFFKLYNLLTGSEGREVR